MSKDEIEELWKQEKINQDRAKSGGKVSPISIISDPELVKKIKTEISQKIEEKKKQKESEKKTISTTDRYKAGDKLVVPEMIKILNGKNKDARNEIYKGLARNYDDPVDYKISEPELVSVILGNINIPEDEEAVIQIAGLMKLNGYVPLFETRLLSGKSKDNDRLLYWLGQDGSSSKAFEFVKTQILDNKIDLVNQPYTMSALEGFSESKDKNIQSGTLILCLEIYNRKLIPKGKFEEIKTTYSSNNPAIDLLNILLKNGDNRVIPIANDMIKKGIMRGSAINTLIRLEGNKHRDLVLKLLKNEDSYFDGLDAATTLYKINRDETIVIEVLQQFERRKNRPAYLIDRIVYTIVDMNATEYFIKLDAIIKDKQLIKSIQETYELTRRTTKDVANDLYEMGIVGKPYEQSIIEKAQASAEYDGTKGFIYNFLSVSRIHTFFDAETGYVPVPYDELIIEISKNSNGKFEDFLVWMDAEENPKDGSLKYKITLIVNDKVFIATPEDIGDWYDVQVVLNLLNTALENSNFKERYVMVDTGDQTVQLLFGPEEKIKEFIDKYQL